MHEQLKSIDDWKNLKRNFEELQKISPDSHERIEDLIDDQIRLRFGLVIYEAIAIKERYGTRRNRSKRRRIA